MQVLLQLGVRSLANASRARQFNSLNPPGVGQIFSFKVRVFIRTCVPNLDAVRRERFLTLDNPLNPPGVGWVNFFFKVRVSILRICVQNLGAVRRERFLTIDNPLSLPGVEVGQKKMSRRDYLSAHACQIWARCGLTAVSKKGSLKFPNERTHTCTNERHQITP